MIELIWYFQCSVVSLNFCKEYLNIYIERLSVSSDTGAVDF